MFKVVATAKYPGKASLSKDFQSVDDPDADSLRAMRGEVQNLYKQLHSGINPTVDLTIRRV
jgi:hypothetical protein